DPKRLSRLFRGELDWVVMKALDKDRNRRYESASAFAADVQRYLHDEPVQACPPSAWYRFRKLARRNKAALTTATLVAVALLLGTVFSTWQAMRATRASQQEAHQRGRAQVNFRRAMDAVEQMLMEIGADQLSNEPYMDPVRRALVERALKL